MRATGTFTYDVPQSTLESFASSQLESDYKYRYSWEDIAELYMRYMMESAAGEFYVTVDTIR